MSIFDSHISRMGRLFFGATNVIILAVALLCINEVSARINARNFISQKISSLQEEFVSRSTGLDSLEDSGRSINDFNAQSSKSSIDRYYIILDDLSFLELSGANSSDQDISNLRGRLEILASRDRAQARLAQLELQRDILNSRLLKSRTSSSAGDAAQNTPSTDSFGGSNNELTRIEIQIEEQVKILTSDSFHLSSEVTRVEDSSTSQNISNIFSNYIDKMYKQIEAFPYRYPSDMLIAISVILSGAIGSALSTMRSGRHDSYYTILTGVFSGYITFLIVKGGRFFFLVSSPDDPIYLNPYALAFSGLIAGMFSDRAYTLLADLVSSAADRVYKRNLESDTRIAGTAVVPASNEPRKDITDAVVGHTN